MVTVMAIAPWSTKSYQNEIWSWPGHHL